MLRGKGVKKIVSGILLIAIMLNVATFKVPLARSEDEWCKIGVEYRAVDGLTVILHSFDIIEKTGSYQYVIIYTLRNDNPDKKIPEGAFKLYYRDENGGLPQYGFFGYLYPGDSITRSYTFEELKSKLFDVLEYSAIEANFFSDEPLPDSLKWKVIYPDTTPPSTKHDYDGTWRNSDFRITLTATDNINRIEDTFYKINNGPVKRVSVDGQPMITSEGTNNTLEYWSVDWAGNEEAPHKVLTGIKLDKTKPSSSITFNGTVGENNWFISNVTVTLTAEDSLSGVDSIFYSFDNINWLKYVGPFTIGDEGTNTIYFKSVDKAGNTETVKVETVAIDRTPPTTVHNYDGLWHNTDFTISLTAIDNESGVAETYYKINNGPVKSLSINGQPLITTESTNNTLEYWSIDNTGNEEAPHKVLTGIKLDKTKPSSSITFNGTGEDQAVVVGEVVKFEASATDNIGIAGYEWDFGDGTMGTGKTATHTYVNTGTYTVTLTVKDLAGNKGTHSITVTVKALSTTTPTTTMTATTTLSSSQATTTQVSNNYIDIVVAGAILAVVALVALILVRRRH